MSVLESAALGVAPIVSVLGGMRELVDHGIDGLRVEPGSADALAGAMAVLLCDDALVTSLGRAARKRMEADHHPDDYADALVGCYESAVARYARSTT